MANPDYKDRPLSKELDPREQLLLVRTMEECGELIQTVTKMLRFGPSNFNPFDPKKETNLTAFRRERDDLLGVLEELGELPFPGTRADRTS